MSTPLDERQRLIEQHQGLVRSLALNIMRRMPQRVDLEDLIAYGQVGLAEAAESFDPQRGGRFSTFAYHRIRGAIYDGASKMSWFGRGPYWRARYRQRANEVLQVEAETEPEIESAASSDQLQAQMRWFKNVTGTLAVVNLLSEGELPAKEGNPQGQNGYPEPMAAAVRNEMRGLLDGLIETLPEESRRLIRAAYFEGLSLQEAGRKLGISKSWASRLHANALKRLARSLKALDVVSWESLLS